MSVHKILDQDRISDLWDAIKDYVDEHGGGSGGVSVGSDVPIGTVISYMGLTAPDGYLICDGTIYNTADYPKLAEAFADQFGSSSYFGGNGTTTFSVPDMRNLFLRGYHGSTTALSGDIGKKQEATNHVPYLAAHVTRWGGSLFIPVESNSEIRVSNADTKTSDVNCRSVSLNEPDDSGYTPSSYTSRPVNMAVLYCIKATVQSSSGGVSMDEVDNAIDTKLGDIASILDAINGGNTQ